MELQWFGRDLLSNRKLIAVRGFMIEERRQYVRRTPISPLMVSLDESRSALLLDVSEGGVSLASVLPRTVDELITLSLELPENRGRFAARAAIAWTRESGHLSGARFVDLDEPVRKQLTEWLWPVEETAELDLGPVDTTDLAVSEVETPVVSEVLRPQSDSTPESEQSFPAPEQSDAVEPTQDPFPNSISSSAGWGGSLFPQRPETDGRTDSTGKYPIRLFLAVMLLTWALVFVGYRMGAKNEVSHLMEAPAAPVPSESAVDAGSISDVQAASMPAPKNLPETPARPAVSAPSVEQPGFVLQVGAMKREGNADSLAQSLQKKKLPAFVFQHGDHFYRVAVGPFADSGSAARAKSALEKNGMKAILRRWSPE
jgi:septal ring-binding cell division protein DamX